MQGSRWCAFIARALVPTFASGWRIMFLIGGSATTQFVNASTARTRSRCARVWAASLFVIGYFVSPAIIIVFGFIASASIGLLVPTLYAYTAEHFPTNARATGVLLGISATGRSLEDAIAQ